MGWAFAGTLTAGTINNVAFAFLHVSVLTVGTWPALRGRRADASEQAVGRADDRAEVAA
jgi:hypothetical protein